MAATYESASALRGVLSRYARDLASYTFNLPPGDPVNQRVLVVAIEETAATAGQAQVITEFLRNARNVRPEIKIALVSIP